MEKAAILKEIIENRRSVFPKSYAGTAIADEILDEIVGSASFAPNHKKTKPWRLKIFRGSEKAQLGNTLAELYKTTTASHAFLEKKYLDISNKVEKSDAVITICVNFSGLVPEWEEVAATAMAVQNMYLTASVYEVGCYWSTPGLIKHLGEFLQLDENQKCYGLFYLGNLME